MRSLLALLLLGACEEGSPEEGAPPVDARAGLDASAGCDDDVGGTCAVIVTVDLDGDCLEVRCTEEAPWVLGCDVQFVGDDPRGCVAILDMGRGLYFQEGNDCDAGRLMGTITCGGEPGPPLSPASCAIDKPEPIYVPSPEDCPDPE